MHWIDWQYSLMSVFSPEVNGYFHQNDLLNTYLQPDSSSNEKLKQSATFWARETNIIKFIEENIVWVVKDMNCFRICCE